MNKYFIYILIFFTPLFSQEIIGEGLNGEDLINYLQNNYKTNSVLSYNNARDILYSEIDIASDNKVSCIYTNYYVILPDNVDPSTYLYENGMNCEHIWPQSMYETITNNNMKSDMHDLRPCKENVNSLLVICSFAFIFTGLFSLVASLLIPRVRSRCGFA